MTIAHDYDVVVLGGGTAGTAAAKAAVAAGAKTVMFNDGELGGLCILRGCMPTKTMLHAAHLVHDARHPGPTGVAPTDPRIDFAALMANKDRKVARFKAAKVRGIENGDYDVVIARARFTGPDTVEADGETYRFAKGAVIATGSVPNVIRLPGIDDVPHWSSDDIMELDQQPDSLLVIGSGAIGLELAQFFARIGTRVELVSRRHVAADVDPEITAEIERMLADEPNLGLHAPAKPVSVRRHGDRIALRVEAADGARELSADGLLLATGRRPALDGIDLDKAAVVVEDGDVVAGPDMRTSNPKIFVAGDTTGELQILHVANWEGRVAGLNAADFGEHEVERRMSLEVTFTDPPLATLGMTEAEARDKDIPVVTASAKLPETGRSITMDVEHGVWKLVADERSGEILGTQMLGPRADEIVHAVAAILYYRGTAADVLAMPWYHPTVSEVMLDLARQIDAQVRS